MDREVDHDRLATDMADGSLFLQGWRDGLSAYFTAEGATPLRRAAGAASEASSQ
ncbi:MAG: hypothetical protein ACRDTH_00565 [Pseudonocardiaceae bacterium]